MSNWIETKVTFEKLMSGGSKKVSESFLVDALTFAEAEARIIKERTPYISGEFKVEAVKRSKITEILNRLDGEKYWLVKWQTITIDENRLAKGKVPVEKKTSVLSLVSADNLMDAVGEFRTQMSGSIVDYEIVQVSETPYLDIYGLSND